jgi:hypothetical protein
VRAEIVFFVDCPHPEIRRMIPGDGPPMAPNKKKFLEVFTKLRGIPRRCFRVLDEEDVEFEMIKQAID